jgi:hypothetical protein
LIVIEYDWSAPAGSQWCRTAPPYVTRSASSAVQVRWNAMVGGAFVNGGGVNRSYSGCVLILYLASQGLLIKAEEKELGLVRPQGHE